MKWFLQALKRSLDFSGRARRSEYWFFVLGSVLISVGLSILDTQAGLTFSAGTQTRGVLSTLAELLLLVPGISVTVRRLHDTNRSGMYVFLGCVPIIGGLLLLFFALQDSDADNAYGPNPKRFSD